MQKRWNQAWSQLGAVAREGLLAELVGRYSEPQRFYHTSRHLEECFAALDPAALLATRLAEVELAVWFHDAIYDPRAHDNEERSAHWAEQELLAVGVDEDAAARVAGLVLATKHDAAPAAALEPGSADAQLLVDVDLSILGSDQPRFTEYEQQVRQEYAWVPDELFRPGRARILTLFLERSSIYSTAWFAGRLEEKARRNLSLALQNLAV